MIEFNSDQIKKAESLLGDIEGALPKVQANAINRALITGRAEVVRAVVREYVISATDIRKTIIVKSATTQNPQGYIISKGSPIALSKFSVQPNRPGVKVKVVVVRVKNSSAYKPIKKAFVTKFASGHVAIAKRVGASRLPIQQLYGPSIPQMIGSDNVGKQIEQKATKMLDQRLDHEINRVLETIK